MHTCLKISKMWREQSLVECAWPLARMGVTLGLGLLLFLLWGCSRAPDDSRRSYDFTGDLSMPIQVWKDYPSTLLLSEHSFPTVKETLCNIFYQ